jgi:peptide-methionine (S)-S-oxide reductase
VSDGVEKAIVAGGCFWGMEDLFRKRPGVISTRVGYTGGDVPNATYGNHDGHADAIEIVFDPERTTYRELLEFFFQIDDPTTLNRQGGDIGTSYPSAIFYLNNTARHSAQPQLRSGGPTASRSLVLLGVVAPALSVVAAILIAILR